VVPKRFAENRAVLLTAGILLVEGPLQNQEGVIHVRARRFESLDRQGLELPGSHDFH